MLYFLSQALVYRKVLSLSSCNKYDESFQESKTGNMTNLIAEDAYNIMSCYWIGHYVWAIPLKVLKFIVATHNLPHVCIVYCSYNLFLPCVKYLVSRFSYVLF